MKYVIASFIMFASYFVNADTIYAGVGIYTQHYIDDSPELNETNNLVYIKYKYKHILYEAGDFSNSYNKSSQYVAISKLFYYREYNYGGGLVVVKGYEGVKQTHFEGLLFSPSFYIKGELIRFTILPAVVNISLEIPLK